MWSRSAIAVAGCRGHGVVAEVAVEVECEFGEGPPPFVVVWRFPYRDRAGAVALGAAEDSEWGSGVSGHVVADDDEGPAGQMHVPLTGSWYGAPVRDSGQSEQDIQAHPSAPASRR